MNNVAIAVVRRMCPRAVPLVMITTKKISRWVGFLAFLCWYGVFALLTMIQGKMK